MPMLFGEAPIVQLTTEAVIGGAVALATTIGAAIWKGIDRLVTYQEKKDSAHAAERKEAADKSHEALNSLVVRFDAQRKEDNERCGKNQDLILSLLQSRGRSESDK